MTISGDLWVSAQCGKHRGPPGYGEHLGPMGYGEQVSRKSASAGLHQVFRIPRGAPDGVLDGGEHSESISGSGCIPGGC